MNLKTFLQGHSFQSIALLVWLVSSVLVMFCSRSIDAIVHGTLYGYGLTFSNNWAQPYWMYQDILYDSQFVSIGLSIVVLIFRFLERDNSNKRAAFENIQSTSGKMFGRDKLPLKTEENSCKPALKPERMDDRPALKRGQNVHVSGSPRGQARGRATGISCQNCKRTLSKALVMLDFSNGNTALVNVCPYCNAVLGKAEEQNDDQVIVDLHKESVR